jgi:NAD kinase
VTVGTNETANWYDGSGVLLSSGSTSYTPSASGTYYAEAQNTLMVVEVQAKRL